MEQKLDVVKVWQDLHKTPELGFEEVKTSAYLAEALEKSATKCTAALQRPGWSATSARTYRDRC